MSDTSPFPNALSASFLTNIVLGGYATHYGPFGSSGVVELKNYAPNGEYSAVGQCVAKSHGMFNTSEEVTLTLGKSTITFNRKDYTGEWNLDGTPIASMTVSLLRKVFHFGKGTTVMRDGTIVRIWPPFINETEPNYRDCVCRANVGGGPTIQMFLQRKGRQVKFIFNRSELGLMEQFSDEIRAVLLGEYLRVKCRSG